MELLPVPKKLGVIKQINPNAFAISYKLETDEEILESKALMSLKKYNMDMVIANLLQTFRTECTIYKSIKNQNDSDDPVYETKKISQGQSDDETSLEFKIISEIYAHI